MILNLRRILFPAQGPVGQQRNTRFRACLLFAFLVLTAVGLKADAMAYAVLQTTGETTFGTLDLNSGVFTPINNSEPTFLTLASFGGSTYAVQETGNTLYQVNPTTGNLTTIGTLSPNAGQLGSTSGALYTELENNTLDSVNPSNAATTLIGSNFEPGFENWYALSNNGSALYLSVESTLYTVAGNGAITAVGTNYGTPVAGDGVAEMGALLFEGGVLYGGQENGGFIDIINPTTGVASDPVALQGAFGGEFIYGLVADVPSSTNAPVPEPASMVLLATVTGLVLFAAKLGSRRSATQSEL